MVHRTALLPQVRRDPAVAVIAMGEDNLMNLGPQAEFFPGRFAPPPIPVIAGTTHLAQPTHPLHTLFALLLRYASDGGVEGCAPAFLLARRRCSISRKAALKKCRSMACWPASSLKRLISSSNSCTFRQCSAASTGSGVASPRPRSAHSGSSLIRHSYSHFRRTRNSRANAATLP